MFNLVAALRIREIDEAQNINLNCGAKGSGDSGPFDIKPKAHAEEEEVPEDEWRESRPLDCTTEDGPILDRPKSWERKSATSPEDIHLKITKEVPSHMG